MSNKHIIELTRENFQEQVLDSKEPILVDFWAEWCGPCRAMAPVLEELAGDFKGRVKIGKLDTDKFGDLASQYNIRSIPTLFLFKNGKIVDQSVGAQPKLALTEWLEETIEN